MSRSLLLVVLFNLFIGVVLADSCLSRPPPLSKGSACNENFPCDQKYFCDIEGICRPKVKEGEPCDNAVCKFPLVCKGPTDLKMCFVSVPPGQACTQDLELGPKCGSGPCVNGRCTGGLIGDSCLETQDCLVGLTCSEEKICTGLPIGSNCTFSEQCVVGSTCEDRTCTVLPTSGNCTFQCAFGFYCQKPFEDATHAECIEAESVAAGQFCESNEVCESLLCHDFGSSSYCAKKSPRRCTRDGDCASDERCACEGDQMIPMPGGFGTCEAHPCRRSGRAFRTCLANNCKGNAYFEGSCIELNCDKEYKRYLECSPAPTLLASFFSVAFFALLSSFFSSHF